MDGTWERLILQAPPGTTAADDRDAWGHVPESSGAGGTFDDVATLYGGVRELPAPDAVRAGLDAAEGAYLVTLYDTTTVTSERVLKRVERSETLEVVSVLRPPAGSSAFMRAYCKRSVL